MSAFSDPLREAREKSGILKCPFHGEDITMLLRHEDVRQAAKDWQTYSSDAPFRVPIPSEEEARSMRQLPIETNPPEHTEYRAIVEPFFSRPKHPEMIAQVEALIEVNVLAGIADYEGAIERAIGTARDYLTTARNSLEILPLTDYRTAMEGITRYLDRLLDKCGK